MSGITSAGGVGLSRLITFRVGSSRYALPAEVVSEVIATGPIVHRLPGPAGDKIALAQVRDRWIPVMELETIVPGAASVEREAGESLLLVVGEGKGRVALRVAEMGAVAEADDSASDSEELVDIGGELVRRLDAATLLPMDDFPRGEEGKAMPEKHEAEPIELITFQVGGEEFGIDVMRVSRVVTVPEIREVPRAPDFVEGVVALGGAALPVIDLRKRFSVPITPGRGVGRLLVVQVGENRLGLIVDEVPGVLRLPSEAVSPAPDFFKGLAGRYLDGIGQTGERLIILLNLDELLTSDERIALGELLTPALGKASTPEKGVAGGSKRRSRKSRGKKADSG